MIADVKNFAAPIMRQRQNALAEMMRSRQQQNPLASMADAQARYDPQTAPQSTPQGDPSGIGRRLLMDLQSDLGLSREEAAGIVGNLAHESGGFKSMQEISPVVEGSRGGYGYAQWTGPRRRAFEAWASERGLDPSSYEANYGFLKHELTGTPEGRVLDSLRGAGSADAAARIFSDKFLRPGIPHMDSRLSLARQYAG